MKLFRGLANIPQFSKGTVATIGNFDGVHRGHQALLNQLQIQANQMQLPLVVLLFEPQPGEFFRGPFAPARLSSLREKLAELRRFNINYVCCLKFNKKLALTKARDFVNQYFFSQLQVKYLLVGEDFRFGQQREGNVHLIQEMGKEAGCEVEIFPEVSFNKERISSTKVRDALAGGDLNRASQLLGRPYSICGRVIPGAGLGRKWGIPTANLGIYRLSLPLKGVFCVQIKRRDSLLFGVANLGSRPTVDGTTNKLEVHIFDFDANLYGERLQVFFLHKLRDEIKFSSMDELIKQINNDIVAAKEKFQSEINFHNFQSYE